ncbi:MAG: hypothetical protein AUH43_22235 [Acidobacteria bacterium 13_1_40CM_65_14]|nr:MAG: hypothetical protein AUH43_22235 [Acidobacteria bacterium 13_1_40CM_65_14]OLC81739.1 MAG: hypothetical protein AUH72_08550 [Acidobacteria bacterium 13_1_40CM_4_65_8]
MIRAEPTEMDGGNGFTNGGTEQRRTNGGLLAFFARRNEKETPIGSTRAAQRRPATRWACFAGHASNRGAPFLRSSMFVLFSVSAEYLAETTKNES